MNNLTHASLFSGIGGFDLAAGRAGFENIFQVEIDDFCQKVLTKNFPNTKKYKDIYEFNGKEYAGTITVLSGGFPCQPFSVAGLRKGTSDDRYLWKEMFRVITEVLPSWVIAENVPGLLSIESGMVFEQVLSDMESAGYETQTFVIPAAGKNAPHRRDRIWIVANNDSTSAKYKISARGNLPSKFYAQNTDSIGGGRRCEDSGQILDCKTTKIQTKGPDSENWNAPDTDSRRMSRCKLQLGKSCEIRQGWSCDEENSNIDWDRHWYEVATEFCGVDDGIPNELYIIRGLENDKVINKEKDTKNNYFIWQMLRKMWEYRETAKTSPELYHNILYDSMSEMPYNRRPNYWNTQTKADKELHYLWEDFYAKSYEEAQDLQSELLIRIRENKRKQKMEESKQRNNRLKSLGNAIVPQVAEEFFKTIKYIYTQ